MQSASRNLEDLLPHLSWARSLALQLVRDSSIADDLVQDAWMAAARKPPRHGMPVRPWLAEVLRNLARMRWRRDSRRAGREKSTFSEADAAANPEELLERLQAQRLLAEIVAGLDEPYRSTILYRYHEGLSATEIGQRQGIPAGTVRWRLKVTLDDIKRQLDDRHGGDRNAWRLVLAPLVPRIEPEKPNSPSTQGEPVMPFIKAGIAATGVIATVGLAFGVVASRRDAVSEARALTTGKIDPPAASVVLAAKTEPSIPGSGPRMPDRVTTPMPATGPSVPTPAPRAHGEDPEPVVSVILPEEPPPLDIPKWEGIARCFEGVDLAGLEGRVDLELTLHETNGRARIDRIAILSANEPAQDIEHPAVLSCVEGTLASVELPVPYAGEEIRRRVTLVLAEKEVSVPPSAPSRQAADPGIAAVGDAAVPSLGPADAPVTIAIFSDFECAFCAQALPRMEELRKKYPSEVRAVFRNLPLAMHPHAQLAAEASLIAHEQGKFWAMHAKLFANQTALDRASLVRYAEEIGLDIPRFEAALDSDLFRDRVRHDQDLAQRLGIRGTPGFVIGDQVIVGVRPIEQFSQIIDEQLAKGRER